MRSPDPNSRYVPRYEATEFPAPINTPVGSSRTEPGTLSRSDAAALTSWDTGPREAVLSGASSTAQSALAALLARVERLERIIREMGLDPEFHFDGTQRQKP